MLRRAALVTFVSALLLAVACGRQITPEPNLNSNGNLNGHVLVRFRVNGTLAFTNYDYQIVIDTCGQDTPYPNPATNAYKNYSYSFNVGTSPYGVATVYPILIQYLFTTGTNGFVPAPVTANPSLLNFTPNSNGQGSEFEVIFDRAQLDNPLGRPQPCPEFTQPPASASVAQAPLAASGVPPLVKAPAAVAVGTTAPTAAAGATPVPTATIPIQEFWKINFIVLTPQGVPVDSLGQGGPTDTSFGGVVVDTQSQQAIPVVKVADSSGAPTDQNASIAGGEVDNYP